MDLFELIELLRKELTVFISMVGDESFTPFLAEPALGAILPVGTFFDFGMAKNSSEDDLVHVTCHRILDEQVICNLIDAHEHQSKLTGRSLFLLTHYIVLNSESLALHLEISLLIVEVFACLLLRNFRFDDLSKLLSVQLAELFNSLHLVDYRGDLLLVGLQDGEHLGLVIFNFLLTLDDRLDEKSHFAVFI